MAGEFVIAPHMRLHELVAVEKGYFDDEGLVYTLEDQLKSATNHVHDLGDKVGAYQYFEARFGVSAVRSITLSPEVLPGAERVAKLQDKVRDLGATCVFSETQLVVTVTENKNFGTGVLDPIGTSINDGPDLYFTLNRNMAASLKNC